MVDDGEGGGAAAAYIHRAPLGARDRVAPSRQSDQSDASVSSPELRRLLDTFGTGAGNTAWDGFVERHSRLLLHIARLVMPDADGAMDAYAHMLAELQRDDCRALRGYVADGRSRFTTWLAVVARRTCVDFYRSRYGRPRSEGRSRRIEMERAARQRLVQLTGAPTDLALIADERTRGPDEELRFAQLHAALETAMSTLGSDDLLLLKLRFEDDLPAQAIASIIGMSTPFHVYRRLRSVCAELRRRLAARGVVESAP